MTTFSKERPVPYSMEYTINLELERMVKQEVFKPIQYSDYASPIVNVLKPDGSTHAYQQIELDEDSKLLMTINT